jgi:hypothetical protein
MPPTREQLDAMREMIGNVLRLVPPLDPPDDAENYGIYVIALEQSWLDLDAQLRWTPCSEAMPTDDKPCECRVVGALLGGPAQVLRLLRYQGIGCWTADEDPTCRYTSTGLWRVTHWRPWSGWPGEEGK